MNDFRVKGHQILELQKYVNGVFGESPFIKVFNDAAASHNNIIALDSIISSSWVPERLFMDVLISLKKEFSDKDPNVCFKAGEVISQVSFNKFYSMFIKKLDLNFALGKAPLAYRLIHSHGDLKIITNKPGEKAGCVVYLSNVPYPTKEYCEFLTGYFSGSVKLHLKKIDIKENKCILNGADHCEFTGFW